MTLLAGRVALITGASRGIGQAVAVAYAREGAHVVLVGRDSKGLEATDDLVRGVGGSATLVALDLRDFAKIELVAMNIAQRFGRLDILVGNAGHLAELTPLPHINPGDWDKTIALNVTANWHLIRCFDALLKTSDAGRAIFVTSGVTQRASPYWGAYAVSKSALESMVKLYASENTNTPLRVNLLDPGRVRTRMRAQAYPGEDPATLPEPAAVTDLFVRLASPALTETGDTFFTS